MLTSGFLPGFPQKDETGDTYTIKERNGVLYIGGDFSGWGYPYVVEPRSGLVAIDIATKTMLPFNPLPVGSTVLTMDFDENDNLYVAGSLTVPGQPYAAAYDLAGTLLPWNPDTGSDVLTIAVGQNEVFLGGYFTDLNGGGANRNYLASVDKSAGLATAFDPDLDAPCISLLVDDANDTLYFGFYGGSINGGGASRNNSAAVNISTSLATAWDPDPDSDVNSLAKSGSTVYMAGSFTSLNAGAFVRYAIAAVDSTTGAVVAAFDASAEILNGSTAWWVALGPQGVYFGGPMDLVVVGNTGFAVANTNTGAIEANVSTVGEIFAFVLVDASIYCAGSVSMYLGSDAIGSAIGAIAIDGNPTNGPAGVRVPWVTTDGQLSKIVHMNGVFYFCGGFSSVTGINGTFARQDLAAADAAGNVLPWAPTHTGASFAPNGGGGLLAEGGVIYVFGGFLTINGSPQPYLAALDTNGNLLPPDFNMNGPVTALVKDGTTLYVAGNFNMAGGLARNSLAKFDTAGVVDPAWDPNVYNTVNVAPGSIAGMAASTTDLYIVGAFDQLNGIVTRIGAAKISKTTGVVNPTWIADTDGVSNTPWSIIFYTIFGTGVAYFAGNFSQVNGNIRLGHAGVTENGFLTPFAVDALSGPIYPTTVNSFDLIDSGPVSMGQFTRVFYSTLNLDRVGVVFINGATLAPLNFAPNLYLAPYTVVRVGNIYYFGGMINVSGAHGSAGLLPFGIPAPPPPPPIPQFLPLPPKIRFLNRRPQNGRPALTLLRWDRVVRNQQAEPTDVLVYRIYRSISKNLEDPVLIAELTTTDLAGFVDTLFVEEIDGYYKYCVSAVNAVGEGEKSCVNFAETEQLEKLA